MTTDREIEKIYRTIGHRIVEIRKQKGFSQEKLAAESNIDRSHMGFIEQGRRRPTIATLYRICRILNISLEKLFKNL